MSCSSRGQPLLFEGELTFGRAALLGEGTNELSWICDGLDLVGLAEALRLGLVGAL